MIISPYIIEKSYMYKREREGKEESEKNFETWSTRSHTHQTSFKDSRSLLHSSWTIEASVLLDTSDRLPEVQLLGEICKNTPCRKD